jgi:hypothetical protein
MTKILTVESIAHWQGVWVGTAECKNHFALRHWTFHEGTIHLKVFSGERVEDSGKSFASKSKFGQMHKEPGESSSASCVAVGEVTVATAPVNPTLPEGF